MNDKQRLIFDLRMKLAAIRQYLRDNSERMTEESKNEALDRIGILLRVIQDLENKK